MTKTSNTWLFLDFQEGVGVPTIWFWRDLVTDESSQQFSTEEAALEALRNGELAFSPPK
ncbi:MAG TPA: hypothetical protein VH934_18690 [Xanthobacteraceae bacterium]